MQSIGRFLKRAGAFLTLLPIAIGFLITALSPIVSLGFFYLPAFLILFVTPLGLLLWLLGLAMAGVTRRLTRPAMTALACAAWLAQSPPWMWYYFHYRAGVWTAPGPTLVIAATVIATAGLLFSGIALARRKSGGLSVFTTVVAAEAEPEQSATSHDPSDPTYVLRNPPAGAQVVDDRGRRVVVLADGSVIGELLNGRAQRFASLNDFRAFVRS
jgi:hypothetical protein